MAFKLRATGRGKALTAVGAAGLVVGACCVLFAGAGPASAAPITKTFQYSCTFPLIGASTIDVTVTADLPDSATVGEPTPAFSFSANVGVPANATQGLNLVGGVTVSGTATAASTLTDGAGNAVDLSVPLSIPSTNVPPDGTAFTVDASGNAPSVTLDNPGTATITVGDVDTTLTPLTAAGQQTTLGQFNAPCVLVGNDNVLATFPVNPAGGGATSSENPTSPPPSENPTTVPVNPTTAPGNPTTVPVNPTTAPGNPTTVAPTTVATQPPPGGAAPTSEEVGLAAATGSGSGGGGSGGGGLPFTGVNVFGPVLAGIVLVGGGIGALLLQRRRSRRAN